MLTRTLTEEQKTRILKSGKLETKVLKYLAEKFQNLTIEVLNRYTGNIMDLMSRNYLEGWCWQTTETAIIFLNDDDYIERGNLYLYFENNREYWHSWICFKYNGEEYAFDPCLNFLCKKSWYSKLFKTDVRGKVTAKQVREELIGKIKNPPQKIETESSKQAALFMEKFFGDALKKQREYTYIEGYGNINSPMYRNSTGYKAEFDNSNPPKIKKLTAHFYYGDC